MSDNNHKSPFKFFFLFFINYIPIFIMDMSINGFPSASHCFFFCTSTRTSSPIIAIAPSV